MKQKKKRGQKKKAPRAAAAQGLRKFTGPMKGLYKVREPKNMVLNAQVRDSGSKVIFDNHTLCSQLLRDYVDLPCLKDVRPEDIEDVSEQYVTLFAQERNSDRVKRVHIGGSVPFFLVSLIEHKTRPDYNVCMQVFRYMVYIWEAYEKEMEAAHKGVAKRADFLYPPILPIVYYEGRSAWNVPLNFCSRIREGETFGKYLPNFEYYLIPLRDYSNETLMEKRDEISLVMMINKLQTAEDIESFRRLPGEEIEAILRDSPDGLVDTIADVLRAFLLKMNVPVPETEKLTDKVREKKMGELFADMEKMDIQAERKNTADARKEADEERRRADEEQKRADEAEKHAQKAQQRADEEQQRADEEQKRADEEQKRADEAEKHVQEAQRRADEAEENSIKSIIELCQDLGMSKNSTMAKLMEKLHLSPEESQKKAGLYWKE